MQRQEINLYRSLVAPAPAANFLSWNRFLLCLALFAMLLTGLYLFYISNLYYLNYQKKKLQTQVETLQKQFFALKNTYPQLFFSQEVSETVSELKRHLEAQKKIFNTLIITNSFSKNLAVLSEITVADVWLTKIAIAEGGNKINLEGASTAMPNVQKYIERIQNEKSLANFSLNINSLDEAEKNSTLAKITFNLTLSKNPL